MNKDDIQLYNGDCLELMWQIPDNSVDAVICDPPYQTTACGEALGAVRQDSEAEGQRDIVRGRVVRI